MNPKKQTYTSITPVLWSRKDKTGLFPIKIRITENRKSFYVNVGWSVPETLWSKSKQRVKTQHKQYVEINYEIERIVKQYESQLEKKGSLKKSKIMVFTYLQEVISRKSITNQYSTRKRYQTLFQHLRDFWGNENLYFYDIDEDFLYDFITHLENHIQPNISDKQPSKNTILNYLGVLKSVFNTCIKEGVYMGENPFSKITLPKKQESRVKPLTKDEIWLLNNLHPDSEGMTEMIWNSINVFLFCFWSQGLRISDCLELKYGDFELVKNDDFMGGFFFLSMKKTKNTLKFPITEKNVIRLLPYIEGIPPLYNWEKRKYPSTNMDIGIEDEQSIGIGIPIQNLTPELEIVGGWNYYQMNRLELYEEMKLKLDNFNQNRLSKNRVDFYFGLKWDMNSCDYHKEFRKKSKGIGKHLIKQHDNSKLLYNKLCLKYFIDYCKKPENKGKFVFPYLRGLENDFTNKRWNKISSSTSLINKYLKKVSSIYNISKFSTHTSRHTFSSISVDMGVDIYDLKKWLGHSSVKITEGYVNSIDTTRQKNHTDKISKFLDE